jgi:integrase
MSPDVLRLIAGSPILSGSGWVPLVEAANLSGVSMEQLLRAASDGSLQLFCRLSWVPGMVMQIGELGLELHISVPSVGVVIQERQPTIPDRLDMLECAYENSVNGIKRVFMSREVADEVLANGLKNVPIRLFYQNHSHVFVTNKPVMIVVERFEVLAAEVDVLRRLMAASVSSKHLNHARASRRSQAEGSIANAGEKAQRRFSEALEAYATAPSGIPGSVTSLAEQKQKHRGCSLFVELVGDLLLGEITADRLREFRQKLKTLPAKVNNIPKAYRRETMAATIEALHDGSVEWPTMTVTAQHERLLWVGQMFTWLVAQGWVIENPTMAVLGEQTQTAAARKAQRQVAAARAETDDDDDRRAFTPDELKLIFSQTHYRTGHGVHVKGNARWYPFEFWLPLIGLFAGCRIGEICQLRLDDIRASEDGTWYFDISETTSDKSLKNANAVRQIPVSPVLVALGLIVYRDRLLKEGYKRLFAELTYAESDARYAKEPIRKMSAMLGALGMPRDSTRVFHCLRANFNDAMLRVPFTSLPFDDPDLKRFIRLKVIGHKLEGVNESHYTNTTMTERSALVQGVQYGLPEIAKFDIEFAVNAVRSGLVNKKGRRRGMEDMGPLNGN